MKKPKWKDRLRYTFDKLLGKGTVTLIGMLILVTVLIVVLAGLFGSLSNTEETPAAFTWITLMHMLDTGTLTADDTSSHSFILLMTFVTVCGIFLTSMLISIVSAGFDARLNRLRKGFSKAVEQNHTVIIGFNDSVYSIIRELVEANADCKKARIVVIGSEEKEFMEREIRHHVKNFQTTKVICRSGNPMHTAVLDMASVETASSVIINVEQDLTTIKCILSVVSYLKKKEVFTEGPHLVAVIREQKNLKAAQIAGEGKAEIIYFKTMLARIIANTCRQTGLSRVLTEVFDYDGNEFYYKHFPQLEGRTFGDCLALFPHSVLTGICRKGKTIVNPGDDMVLQPEDQLILLAEDEDAGRPQTGDHAPEADLTDCISNSQMQWPPQEYPEGDGLLILGHNDLLPLVLQELDDFLPSDTRVVIACDSLPENAAQEWAACSNLRTEAVEKDIYDQEVLKELLSEGNGIRNALLLSDSELNRENADERSILLLLQLRALEDRYQTDLAITSEINSVENQRLLSIAKVNDFVVGSSITNLIVSQISQNRHLADLFRILLTAEGSEFYIRDAASYVKPGAAVDGYALTEQARRHGEIYVGYRCFQDGQMQIRLNPEKGKPCQFAPGDGIIVLAGR